MTRRSRLLWCAALLWAVAPAVHSWIQDLLTPPEDPPEEYGESGVIYGMVQLFSGGRILKIAALLEDIHDTPAFALGVAPYVLLGLGACLLAARRGRPGPGRVVTRFLPAVLVLVYCARPLFFLAEAAQGTVNMWDPQRHLFSDSLGDLCQLVAVLLMVLALRPAGVSRETVVHRLG
ncbi:hypothetical protein ACFFMN_15300 [Planobispora siamensis]|uniref:hypothetical protein n=1 Tax=Planobispora siamensis TaxID=936338 RepID=UPI0019508D95|nr:hypothetical protein [Planobispora siamensis]